MANERKKVEVAEADTKEDDSVPTPGKGEVLVFAPRAFNLRPDHDTVIHVKQGLQVLKKELADHWYCKAHGLKVQAPAS